MNAMVLDGAIIGAECPVAALSLVRSDMVVPPRSLVSGNSAAVVRSFEPHQVSWRNDGEGAYQSLAAESLNDLVETTPLQAVEEGRPRLRSDAVGVLLSWPVAQQREQQAQNARIRKGQI